MNIKLTFSLTVLLAVGFAGRASAGQIIDRAVLTGSVTHLQRVALPPDAAVHVQLQDVSLPDGPPRLVAETIVPAEGKKPPIRFRLEYPTAAIDPEHDYVLQASIMAGGKMLFATVTAYSVITHGAPATIGMLVLPVGADWERGHARTAPFSTPVTFTGDLPCADCAGLRFTVTLRPDGIFLARSKYRGKAETVHDLGRWSLADDGSQLLLSGDPKEPRQFSVKGADSLRQLDGNGHEIVSEQNLDLKRADTVDPIDDSFRMTGDFVRSSDAGLLTECRTGARWPVALEKDAAALERAYSTSHVEAGKPLHVAFAGHFANRTDTAGSGQQELIVIDKFARAFRDRLCPAPAAMPLEGTDWQLTELDGAPLSAPPGAALANLLLNGDGRKAVGSSACNSFSGGYQLEKDRLRFTPMVLTMMTCMEPMMKQEQALIAAFRATSGYRIAGETLELRDGERVVARFVAETR